jgi:hypothetical protein
MTKLLSCPVPRESDLEAGPLVSNNQCYEQYLVDQGYAAGYIKRCKSGVKHLSRWMGFTQKKADEVCEALIAEFLDVHLPRCSCRSVLHDRSSLGAALGHLLAALRATGAIHSSTTKFSSWEKLHVCFSFMTIPAGYVISPLVMLTSMIAALTVFVYALPFLWKPRAESRSGRLA